MNNREREILKKIQGMLDEHFEACALIVKCEDGDEVTARSGDTTMVMALSFIQLLRNSFSQLEKIKPLTDDFDEVEKQ